IRPLVMQAAQHAPGRTRNVGLHEAHVDTEFRVLRRMEALEEVAARVAVHHGFDDANAGQIGVDAFEVGMLSHAMRFSYCFPFSPREKGRNAAFSFARSAG